MGSPDGQALGPRVLRSRAGAGGDAWARELPLGLVSFVDLNAHDFLAKDTNHLGHTQG